MAWKNILDMRRAVDYLASRPDVNADALGCYGHSMGSTHAWLVGPWEPRLRAIVGNCCMPSYAAIHDKQLLHCFPNFIPGLHNFGDVPDIAARIAPRPLHLNLGENDRGSPIEHVQTGLVRIAEAYTESGAAANFTSYIEPGAGHVLSQEMWLKRRDFFARHLVDHIELSYNRFAESVSVTLCTRTSVSRSRSTAHKRPPSRIIQLRLPSQSRRMSLPGVSKSCKWLSVMTVPASLENRARYRPGSVPRPAAAEPCHRACG